jgi:hypothetical protein
LTLRAVDAMKNILLRGNRRLTDQTNSNGKRDKKLARKAQLAEKPGWIHGLRQLYDSTVNEPLPPSFEELLRKLDEGDGSKS